MSVEIDHLGKLQEDIVAAMLAEPWFADIPVLVRDEGVINSDVENKLKAFNTRTGKVGACVLIMLPFLDTPDESPGPRLDVIVPIRVFEMPLVNRATGGTGKTIGLIELNILNLLHLRTTTEHFQALFADKRASEEFDTGNPKMVGKEIFIRTHVGLKWTKTPRVDISLAGSLPSVTVTLACQDVAAQIRYTLDGSYPGPTSTLYTTPFTQATAATVRAAAYAAGKQGSDINHKAIA